MPPSTAAPDASDGAGLTEVVSRPEPGIGRGRWEAPAWVFAAVAIAAVVGGLAWLTRTVRAVRERGRGGR